MEIKVDNLSSVSVKSALYKSDKALEEFLKRCNLRRDMDVVEIYLGSHDLNEIRSLEKFKNLNRLWLQSNKIKKLPFIQNCHSLSEIYLQNNMIQTIENCFRNLKNLSVLFLHANQITDLDSTANELSYLKYLKNLNLFDNPIALEKNYRNLVIYKISSLEIFDRNTISKDDRFRSIKIYDPEKIEIEQKRAFLRCTKLDKDDHDHDYHHQTNKNNNQSSKFEFISKNNLNNSQEIFKENSSTTKQRRAIITKTHQKEILDDSSDITNELEQLNMRRSIKELSYFDWSKVKLYENDYLIDQNAGVNLFSSTTTTTIPNKQQNKLSKNSSTLLNNTNNANYKSKDLKDLPQVITIRFT